MKKEEKQEQEQTRKLRGGPKSISIKEEVTSGNATPGTPPTTPPTPPLYTLYDFISDTTLRKNFETDHAYLVENNYETENHQVTTSHPIGLLCVTDLKYTDSRRGKR